jgi:hypothetical protein
MPSLVDYIGVPESYRDGAHHRRMISQVVNGLLVGRSNNRLMVTLEASATETVVRDARFTERTVPSLTPLNAAAATAVGAGVVWVEPLVGKVKIHHDASATERIFGLVWIG